MGTFIQNVQNKLKIIAKWNFEKWIIRAFILIGATLWNLDLSAQNPPTSFELIPQEFEDGDTIDLAISYGTLSEPARDVLSVSFTFVCEGFTIDPASQLSLDLSNSYFAFNSNWTGTTSTNSFGDTLIVTLERDDDVPAEGYGEIAMVSGIVAEIDELIGVRKLSREFYLKGVEVLLDNLISVRKSPHELYLKGLSDSTYEISIYDVRGLLMMERQLIQGNDPKPIDISHIPSGPYSIHIRSNGFHSIKKIIHVQKELSDFDLLQQDLSKIADSLWTEKIQPINLNAADGILEPLEPPNPLMSLNIGDRNNIESVTKDLTSILVKNDYTIEGKSWEAYPIIRAEKSVQDELYKVVIWIRRDFNHPMKKIQIYMRLGYFKETLTAQKRGMVRKILRGFSKEEENNLKQSLFKASLLKQ